VIKNLEARTMQRFFYICALLLKLKRLIDLFSSQSECKNSKLFLECCSMEVYFLRSSPIWFLWNI